MILSIGMIVKNEEKYLRSCLEAIKPILDQLDSELIIADTGSTDSTVEIAKEFTDHVFYFKWCDDFAAARNSTLERARGEWFMALDGDEIFQDVSEIVAFFNSGEYRNYKTASYQIRNIKSKSNQIFSDQDLLRMTRIEKNTRYESPIHESFPFLKPVKKLTAMANHFGYMNEDNQEFLKAKSRRNIELLIKALEQDPENCKYYLEIGQAYGLNGDFEASLSYRKKGLKLAKMQQHPLLTSFYADLAFADFAIGSYQEALDVTREYFGGKGNNDKIDLQMLYIEAGCFYLQKNYKQAITAYTKYLKRYEKNQSGALRSETFLQYAVKYADHHSRCAAETNLAHAFMMEANYASASELLKRMPLSDWKDDEKGMKRRLLLEFDLMRAAENFERIPDLFRQAEGKTLVMLQTILENTLENTAEERMRALILSHAATKDLLQTMYGRLLKLRRDFYYNTLSKRDLEEFVTGMSEWTPLYADAIYLALRFGVAFSFLASQVDVYRLDQLLLSSRSLHFQDLAFVIQQRCDEEEPEQEQKTLGSELWRIVLLLGAMKSGQLDAEQAVRAFHMCGKAAGDFLEGAFRSEILQDVHIRLLPGKMRTAYHCCRAGKLLKQGEKADYIKELKKVLALEPELKDVIKVLADRIQTALGDAPKKEEASEALCPGDPELPELKLSFMGRPI